MFGSSRTCFCRRRFWWKGSRSTHRTLAGLTDGGSAARSGEPEIPLGNGFSLTEHLEGLQREFLARAMRESGGKKTTAAKLLGYPNYQTLAAQLERLGVKW